MAAGTVGYTDTRGNKDYTSIIANQIKKRLTEASDMASDERAYAEKRAEEGGTSLEEAGIGKGYFFGRALGSRFGGDRIARTKGRMGVGGAGTNPAANYKQRFRGGFDYNVTNQVSNITDTVPLSNAVVQGLRGVQGGLIQVAAAISRQDSTMDSLANTQADMAKAIMFNGYLFQMFMSQQKARSGSSSLRREERSIEGGGRGRIGGAGFGGSGGKRGMINITPSGGSGGSGKPGGGGGFAGGGRGGFGVKDLISFGTGGGALQYAEGATTKIPKIIENFSTATPFATTSSKNLAQILAGNSDEIATNVGKRLGASPNVMRGIGKYLSSAFPFLKSGVADEMLGLGNTITQAKFLLGKHADDTSVLLLSKALGAGGSGANSTALREAMIRYTAAMDATKAGRGAGTMMDTMFDIGKMSADEQIMMMGRFGDDAERLMSLGFANPNSRIIQQISKKFPGVKFTDPMQAVAMTEIANRVDKGMDLVDAITDVRNIYGTGIDNAIASASKLIPEKSKLAAALAEMVGKTASKGVFKSVLKQIPVIAGVAGVIFGIQRALEGDLMGAGLEITSGLLGATGTTPGIGLAIDGYLLGRDLGAMPGFYKGGQLGNFPANSFLSINGMPVAKMNERGGYGSSETVEVKPNDPKQYIKEGKGIVQAMYDEKQKFSVAMGLGVEKGLTSVTSGGGVLSGIKDFFFGDDSISEPKETKEEFQERIKEEFGIIGDRGGLGYRDGRVGYENQKWDFFRMIPDDWFNNKKEESTDTSLINGDNSQFLSPLSLDTDLSGGQYSSFPLVINNIYNGESGEGMANTAEIYGSSFANSSFADFAASYSIMNKM